MQQATANVLANNKSQLIILRQETGFDKPWKQTTIEANKDLVDYLVTKDVLP